MSDLESILSQMRHSAVRNYVVPGLTSWLLGGNHHGGRVRLFTSDRDSREWVTPHSHRFDFACLVLKGCVTNIIYKTTIDAMGNWKSNRFAVGTLQAPAGGMGDYSFEPGENPQWFEETVAQYYEGDTYVMTRDEIHSIQFSRGAVVLFLEGPELTTQSIVLEPWSDDARVPTFETRSWMFKR